MNIDARELTLVFDGNADTMTLAVDNIDISLVHHEKVGIMGPTGSGKSSLLYLLSGLKKATSGTVFYDGTDIKSLSEKQMDNIRAKRFGFIFQRHFLISYLTIEENILLPLGAVTNSDRDFAQYLMDELDILPCSGKLPHELSVGERQKAAVIRAMIGKPEFLFADEPTAALDIDSALDVIRLLETTMPDTGMVVVTHDYKILKNVSRILHMRDGRIV